MSDANTPNKPAYEKLCVVYITDGNVNDQCRMAWSLRSLVRKSRLPFDVIALSNKPIVDLNTAVPEIANHGEYRNVLDMYDTLHSAGIFRDGWNRNWPFEVLYRLGIPLHSAFYPYDRVLYLDTDTIVFSDRIDSFLGSSLSGFEIGGVPDTVQEEHDRIGAVLHNDLKPEHADKLIDRLGPGLFTRSYINAGVILWNLPEIRADIDWYRERLLMFWDAETRGKVGFLDQDFINVMTKTRSDYSLVFNWFNRCGAVPDPGKLVTRHYCGKNYAKMASDASSEGLL